MVWFDVVLNGKPFETYKVQIPPRVPYTVSCDSCSYQEVMSFGVRYLDIRVYRDGRVYVYFPEPKFKGRPSNDFRTHLKLAGVLNPNPNWVDYDLPKPHSLPRNPFSKAEVWIKIKITKSGIYEIPFSELSKLGININSYPRNTIKMIALLDTLRSNLSTTFNFPYEIPIWIDEGGQRILFWGESQKGFRVIGGNVSYFENPYTDTTYYFLGLGGEIGKRITVVNFPPGPSVQPIRFYRFEENINNLGKKGRVWLGREMSRTASDPDRIYTYNFNLSDILSGISFKTRVANGEFSDTSARLWVRINGQICDSAYVRVRTFVTLSCSPPLSTNNTLEYILKPFFGSQTLYLDYYEVSYVSNGSYWNEGLFFVNFSGRFTLNLKGGRPVFVWDVTNPYEPKIIQSYTYSSGNLFINDSSNGWARIYISNFARRPISLEILNISEDLYSLSADYVAVGSREFSGTFRRLLDFRSGKTPIFNGSRWEYSNVSTAWANIEDIYTQFSLGNPDPVAIRNFLYNIYLRDPSKPRYVVLVGDGNYDYKNFAGFSFPKQVPPYYPIDSSLSVNLDNFGAYDDFYGDFDGDGYSDIALGRIPIRDNTELSEYIEKVIDYENLKNDGIWRYNVLLVADDERSENPTSCEIFHTYDVLYTVRSVISPRINTIPFLLQKYPLEGSVKPSATSDLIKILNSGVLMVSFFIHGNPVQMAHERLLTLSDVGKINTKGRESFITVLSCKVGSYDRTDPVHVLGEELMLKRNRGIAVLSTTALAFAGSNAIYARAMYNYLSTYGKAPLGYLSLVGKNDRYYVLLGDPAIMLKLPDSLAPVSSDTLKRGAKNWAYVPKGKLGVFDIPEWDTVSFNCLSIKYPYAKGRTPLFYGDVPGDTVRFWVPLRGLLTSSDTPTQKALLNWWDGDRGYSALYPISKMDSSLGSYKPKVYGYYGDIPLENGMFLPSRVRLKFLFESKEGFDIRTSGNNASPPRILIDNLRSEILEVKILNDTLAEAYYDLDFSSSPGKHRLGVSITSAKGVKGYNVWDLEFSGDSLKIDLLLAYPNPYRNGKFYITFNLTKRAEVSIKIYTPTGLIVDEIKRTLKPGFNSVEISTVDRLANGIYVAVVDARSGKEKVKAFTRFVIMR